MNHPPLSSDRIVVTYQIQGSPEKAREEAQQICLEQTVEVVEELAQDPWIQENLLGRLEAFESLSAEVQQATISYPVEITAGQLPQFLSVIFGNISLWQHVRLEALHLPESFLDSFPGPRFGVEGLRQQLNVPQRPLLATALKPMGLPLDELARCCYEFARGGIDMIKDDHGLVDQPFCPFEERVKACVEAVARARQETGHKTLYFASVTDRFDLLESRARFVQEAGGDGLLFSPLLTGLDALRYLAEHPTIDLPLMAHPAWSGAFFWHRQHGISHAVLLGTLLRLAGADLVIFPSFRGRFPFTQEQCQQIVTALQEPQGHLRRAWPVPAGGLSPEDTPALRQIYKDDVLFLIGSALYTRSPHLSNNVREFRALVET